ncbi:GDSL-like Lipase/Acylhydrolase-domain-containing protein [Mycotypha africana]|uniref:GDSL-like Lipase/Acylhydrolase-domain-containing protein n=1 Tax=Mycotypha africana TaxID=64632 RepID=UPI0022FFE4DE|nr:GDSL-like Lipase/Acylhydrolase-domain-containing protein [Mycotypha africana]KAI8973701.1 GDSL-like Lipase/Acylhydrolase-domain-containing protein [Mycotypha africana]
MPLPISKLLTTLLILPSLLLILSATQRLLVSAQNDASSTSAILDERINNIVVFGDSYSDVGNQQRLTNGPLWSENLAVGWNASLYSFAFSGAVCDNDLYPKENTFIPSITDQIEMFYEQYQADHIDIKDAMNETVFIFWVGLNDVFKITSTTKDTSEEEQQYSRVVECIGTNIRNIRKLFGANKFIVFGIPPFEKMPYFSPNTNTNSSSSSNKSSSDPKNKEAMERAAHQLDELLARHVEKMNKHLQYLELDLVDVHKLIDDIVSQPAIFDLKNAHDAYWEICQGQCQDDVNSYVWWDSMHLTGGIHRLIANSILMAGSLAPETYLPDDIDVEAYLYKEGNVQYKSPKFKAAKNTGEIERAIHKLNEDKLSEAMNHIVSEQEEILSSEHNNDEAPESAADRSRNHHIVEFSHIYLMMGGLIFISIGFLLFLRKTRRRGAAKMNALSSLLKKNHKALFRPLRNMDNEV